MLSQYGLDLSGNDVSNVPEQISPLNLQLKKALLSDLHYVDLLFQYCEEFRQLDGLKFDECCIRVHDSVKNIRQQETRFLILREFLLSQDECLPVLLLWAFEREDLLHFPVYLSLKPMFISELSKRLSDVLFMDTGKNLDVVITLLKPTFVSVCLLDPILGCPSEEFHSTFQAMLIDRVLCNSNQRGTNLISRLTKEPHVLSKLLLPFVKQILRRVLLYTHNKEELPSFTDAIGKQTDCWTYSKIPDHIIQFIKQLLDCLFVEDIIKIIYDLLNDSDLEMNKKWLLIVVSVLIVTITSSGEILKKTLDQWMKEAVAKKNKHYLGAIILIARQCFAESVPPFTSYASWFSSLDVHFELARDSKFFIDFLSEIVPYEPSIYLKVHINKVPSVPAGVHAALSDYISLAKTRLADLNETTDYIGLFGEYKTSEKAGRESDVARVVSHFKETGNILKTVIEASVFRRTYYECVFLADLLQTEIDKQNPRYKLIEKLHGIGKLPNAMFVDWVLRSDIARKSKREIMEIE